jgi:hypothetical protein
MRNEKNPFVRYGLTIVIGLLVLLPACVASELTLYEDPIFRYTKAAQTVFVQLTKDAPTITPIPTELPTFTTVPATLAPATITPTPTPEPTVTSIAVIEPTPTDSDPNELIDQAQLVLYTPPIDQIYSPGGTFEAQVGFRNVGPNVWNNGYSMRFLSGNSFAAARKYTLESYGSQTMVAPGEEVAIAIPAMTAPAEPGTYISNWCFYNNREEQGLPPQCFYIVSFQIIVQQ